MVNKYIKTDKDDVKKMVSTRVYAHLIDEFRELASKVDVMGGELKLSFVINKALEDSVREAHYFIKEQGAKGSNLYK